MYKVQDGKFIDVQNNPFWDYLEHFSLLEYIIFQLMLSLSNIFDIYFDNELQL